MNPRIFVGTMALGYDYLLLLNMFGVLLLALLIAVGAQLVEKRVFA